MLSNYNLTELAFNYETVKALKPHSVTVLAASTTFTKKSKHKKDVADKELARRYTAKPFTKTTNVVVDGVNRKTTTKGVLDDTLTLTIEQYGKSLYNVTITENMVNGTCLLTSKTFRDKSDYTAPFQKAITTTKNTLDELCSSLRISEQKFLNLHDGVAECYEKAIVRTIASILSFSEAKSLSDVLEWTKESYAKDDEDMPEGLTETYERAIKIEALYSDKISKALEEVTEESNTLYRV